VFFGCFEPSCLQLRHQFGLIVDVFLEDGHPSGEFIDPVGVTAAGSGKTQLFGNLGGHIVLIICEAAVADLNGVDILEDPAVAGLFHGHLQLADTEGFEPAEGMGCDHETIGCLNGFAQFLDEQQIFEFLVKAKDQDIPLVGCKLVSPKDLYAALSGETLNIRGIPEDLMFGETDSIQFQATGLLDQFKGVNVAAGRARGRVNMQVDSHFSFSDYIP